MGKIHWTKFLGMFVLLLFFLLITFRDSELWAQQCPPDPVPICMEAQETCNDSCATGQYCCSSATGPPCGALDAMCAPGICQADPNSICQVQECTEPAGGVKMCGVNEPECQKNCTDANPYCCPTSGVCLPSYDDVCNAGGNNNCKGFKQDSICKNPECKTDLSDVRICGEDDRAKCPGNPNDYCCPDTGTVDPDYKKVCLPGICGGFKQDTICRIPPLAPAKPDRSITFINECDEDIWVGGSNKGSLCSKDSTCKDFNDEYRCHCVDQNGNPTSCDGKTQGSCVDKDGKEIIHRGEITGFHLPKTNQHTITVPGSLNSGNFWPRLNCKFPCTEEPCCETGDCSSAAENKLGIQCDGGTKKPPANSFEPTFNFSDAPVSPNDFYDLTNVDGFVVGIQVKQVGGTKLWRDPTVNVPGGGPPKPKPELNCGEPACKTFNMTKCPPELKQSLPPPPGSTHGLDVCWSIGLAADDPEQRNRDSKAMGGTGILFDIAGDCKQLALHKCSAEAIPVDTDNKPGVKCPTGGSTGCPDSNSLFACSPYNSNLPAGHGGICCADMGDPLYVNPCAGNFWKTPDTAIPGRNWCNSAGVPQKDCSYSKIFSSQCGDTYSWQFNDNDSTFQCINPDYEITFCPRTGLTDHDNDGLPANSDLDSDGDGIPDDFESSFSNEGLTMAPNSNDGTRAALESSLNDESATMNFTSRDGVNPNLYERDGDGIAHQYDLDSDGDGIPDHVECGGENDSDRDGMSDNYVDSDGDGLHDEHDEDYVGNVLDCPDTDGDGVPDFLDTDSDGDGVADANETIGGMDVDGDGIHDDSEDLNGDGLADSVHPDTGDPLAFMDSDGDGIFDHLDSSDATGGVSGGCSIASVGSTTTSLALYLLIPVFILFRRVLRKYR